MTTAPSSPLVDAGLAPAPIGISVPKKLHPPLDLSAVKKEEGVKKWIKLLLNAHGWFVWMPAANGFGKLGVHDFNAIKDGVFITVEAKFKYSKPTAHQKSFAAQIMANSGFSFCVNERNMDHLAYWLESFEIAKQCQIAGREVPPEHGSRMLNSISVLTDLFAADE